MAYTQMDRVYEGQREIDLTFATGFAARSDVSAYMLPSRTSLDFEWVSDARIRIVSNIPVGTEFRIERTVSKEQLPFDLTQPSQGTKDNIQQCVLHSFRAVQELLDGRFSESLNVGSIVERAVDDSVRAALNNFVFQTSHRWDYQIDYWAGGEFVDLPISPGHILDLSDLQIVIDVPPTTRSEVTILRSGQIVQSFFVTATGEIEGLLPGVKVTTDEPLSIRAVSPVLEFRAAVPATYSAYVDMNTVLGDYVQTFEEHRL